MGASISRYIQSDLKARLRSGDGAPAPLTLVALAEHYGVSLSPVRFAVRQLLRERVLLKKPNGRLEPNPRANGGPAIPAPVAPASSRDLEAALTQEVIRMALRGTSEFLRENATAKELGIGRTALRPVLGRLAGLGLIEYLPRRGWRVRPLDEADVRAYLQMRECLELQALELARPRLDRAKLEEMLRGNAPGSNGKGARLDNRLHRYLIDLAGNRYLRDFFDRHGAYYSALFDYAAPKTKVVEAMAAQHRTILQALLDGDWDRARQGLVEHIRAQWPILQRLLRQLNPTNDVEARR
jgi:DNA-binding GntR family transcriptional regulator